MKTSALAALAALCVSNVAAHATFQALWVDGVDFNDQCARVPPSNSPVTNVASNDVRCNAGTSPIANKCPVKAGGSVTIEMHQVCEKLPASTLFWSPPLLTQNITLLSAT